VSNAGQIPRCKGRIEDIGTEGGLVIGTLVAFVIGVSGALLLKMFVLQF
jgi:hypothetical protein